MNRMLGLAAVLLLFASTESRANIITFSGLTGVNDTPFTTYEEAGFRVAAISGTYLEGHIFGNPSPSIFGISRTGTVEVTQVAPGPFTFSSVDLANANFNSASVVTYTIQGFLGNISEFSITGTLMGGDPSTFSTITNGDPALAVDRLDITQSTANFPEYNIDNIVVTPAVAAPEPSTLVMCGISGLIGLGVRLARRRAA